MYRTPKSELGEIALVGFGIWFLYKFSLHAAGTAAMLQSLRAADLPPDLYFALAVHGIAGFFLVFLRKRLSLELFGSLDPSPDERLFDLGHSREFLVSLFGLWFVCSGLIDGVEIESKTLRFPPAGYDQSLFDVGRPRNLLTSEAWIARVSYMAEIGLGAALFLTGGKVVELWVRLREAGRPR